MKNDFGYSAKGDFKNLTGFLERARNVFNVGVLNKYGRLGVEALKEATPKKTGETADSWYYEIKHSKNSATITFCNSNIQNGYNVAIILQTGHATRSGYWVQGVDYINPALKPIFEEMANNALKEATEK